MDDAIDQVAARLTQVDDDRRARGAHRRVAAGALAVADLRGWLPRLADCGARESASFACRSTDVRRSFYGRSTYGSVACAPFDRTFRRGSIDANVRRTRTDRS